MMPAGLQVREGGTVHQRRAKAVPAVTLGLAHPRTSRFRCAAHLAGNGRDRRPLRRVLRTVLSNTLLGFPERG
jgi:hypothetical protein